MLRCTKNIEDPKLRNHMCTLQAKRTTLPIDVEGNVALGLREQCSHIIQNTCPNILAPPPWPVFLTIQKIRYTI